MSLACTYCGAPQPEGTAETSRCLACRRPLTEPDFGDDQSAMFIDGPLQLDDNRTAPALGVDSDGKASSGPPPAFDEGGVPAAEVAAENPAMSPTDANVSAPPPVITEPDIGAVDAAVTAHANEQGVTPAPGPLDEVTFPSDELSHYVAWRWLWLQRQPVAQRIFLIAAAPVALVFLVSIPYCIGASVAAPEEGSVPTVVYLQETHPLLSRPRLETVEQSEGRLARGAKLTRYDQLGDYVMVRDYLGRSGYVLYRSLGPEPPPSLPENHDFPDCAPGYGEEGSASCKARAQRAGTRCHEACPDPVADTCEPLCDERLATCLAACDDPPADKPPCPVCKKPSTSKAASANAKPKRKRKKKRK